MKRRSKEVQHLIDAAIAQGWRLEQGAKHPKLRSPSGEHFVVIAHDHGTSRHVLNFRAELRRRGVNV